MIVGQVIGAVMALTQLKEDYTSAQKVLTPEFVEQLVARSSFPMSAVRRARTQYVAGNHDFTPAVVVKRTGNRACASLCAWVLAVVEAGSANNPLKGAAANKAAQNGSSAGKKPAVLVPIAGSGGPPQPVGHLAVQTAHPVKANSSAPPGGADGGSGPPIGLTVSTPTIVVDSEESPQYYVRDNAEDYYTVDQFGENTKLDDPFGMGDEADGQGGKAEGGGRSGGRSPTNFQQQEEETSSYAERVDGVLDRLAAQATEETGRI
jgi:hypothetical protein